MAEENQAGKITNPLYELAEKMFGFNTYIRPTFNTIGAAVAEIAPSNPNRLGYLLTNNSASIIYIAWSPDVSATQGFPLAANGGSLIMLFRDHGLAVTQTLWGLGAAAALNYSLQETIILGG